MKQQRHYIFSPAINRTVWVGENRVRALLDAGAIEFVHSTVYDGSIHNYYNFLEHDVIGYVV